MPRTSALPPKADIRLQEIVRTQEADIGCPPGYHDKLISGLVTYLNETAQNVTAFVEGEKVEQMGEIIPWPEDE